MKTPNNLLRHWPRHLLLALSLSALAGLPLVAAAQSSYSVADTVHYRVTMGVVPYGDLQGTETLKAISEGYARTHDSQSLSNDAAVQLGLARVITAAVFDRHDGRRLGDVSLTAIVSRNEGEQVTQQFMYPIRVNGHTTYETVVSMPPGAYTIDLSISRPDQGEREVAAFSRTISQ